MMAHFYPSYAAATLELAALIAREVTAGVLIGTMARLIMSALEVAGTLIATQTGLAFAQTFDPSQSQQSAIIGTFLSLLGIVLVFESGLHHLDHRRHRGLLHAAAAGRRLSHRRHGAACALDSSPAPSHSGLQLAAPFIVFGFLIYATLGVLSRLMPQLQVFFLAMPLNILVGLRRC